MKKLVAFLLALCLVTGIVAPAHAESGVITVRTVSELQDAVDFAEDGDVIAITKQMTLIGVNLFTEKNVTITRTFLGQPALQCFDCTFNGLNFADSFSSDWFILICNGASTIENCTFSFSKHKKEAICIIDGVENTVIRGCTFDGNMESFIFAGDNTSVLVEDSTFIGAEGSVINNRGTMCLRNCTVQGNLCENTYGICNYGTIDIENSIVKGNLGNGDIFSKGVVNFSYAEIPDFWFYDTETGIKADFSVVGSDFDDGVKLICLSQEESIERFGIPETPPGDSGDNSDDPKTPSGDVDSGETVEPTEPTQPSEGEGVDSSSEQPEVSPQEPISPPASGEGDDNPEQTPEQSKEPLDSEGKKDEGDSTDKQPETSDQPPQDEDGDNSDNNPPQSPEQSIDPPQGDNITDTTPDAPQQTQEPIGSTSSYISYWPSVRPTRPIVTTTAPTDEAQIEPEIPAPARKPLVCNGAAIDTSKTIVLLGYGDGQLHEADSLTRAQLATIIFRLLDDDTVARYGGAGVMFTDVAADAWYAPYVNVIGTAGIVSGVGNGMYDPDGTVTWAQIITILTRFVAPENYELQYIQYSGWALEAIQTAVALEWIEDSSIFNPDAIISRGELVNLINTVLERYQ